MTRAEIDSVFIAIDQLERRFNNGSWDDLDVKLLLAIARAGAASNSRHTQTDINTALVAFRLGLSMRKKAQLAHGYPLAFVERKR
jgi:hypothetical protein